MCWNGSSDDSDDAPADAELYCARAGTAPANGVEMEDMEEVK